MQIASFGSILLRVHFDSLVRATCDQSRIRLIEGGTKDTLGEIASVPPQERGQKTDSFRV